MIKKTGLGKGMGALLHTTVQDDGRKYFSCPIEEIRPNHKQPRKTFPDAKIEELAASIREKGIIQPLVVRRVDDYYQIIAGERRWRASQKAGLREVPVVIKDVSEDFALEMALIENIQREDLNPIEEADAYRNLIETFDLSQEEVAKRVGKERSTVANALRLLRLPEVVRNLVIEAKLSMGQARALLSLEDASQITAAAQDVLKKNMTVRETETLVKRLKSEETPPARPQKTEEKNLELLHLASELKRSLGTQVKIMPKGRGGKVEISYYSAADLDRLLEILGISS
jgi:ParB family chromosome partitioning protein